MPKFAVQYIREQRVYREIEAKDDEEARDKMEDLIETFKLDSEDDESDDGGEISFVEPVED